MAAAESSGPDEELVLAVLDGDENAFAELARRHKSRVFGLVSRFARNGADLEDICQEVFTQAFLRLRQFRRDSPFEHWLLRIATHKSYDYLRRRRRADETVSADALFEAGFEPAAPGHAAPSANLEKLHAALAQLPAQHRIVLTLLCLEERSLREVSGLTGWSVGSVKVRAFRARLAVRKLMEKMT
jgi:RNA polymerase sigma-70 factor (ECF subfamily)